MITEEQAIKKVAVWLNQQAQETAKREGKIDLGGGIVDPSKFRAKKFDAGWFISIKSVQRMMGSPSYIVDGEDGSIHRVPARIPPQRAMEEYTKNQSLKELL